MIKKFLAAFLCILLLNAYGFAETVVLSPEATSIETGVTPDESVAPTADETAPSVETTAEATAELTAEPTTQATAELTAEPTTETTTTPEVGPTELTTVTPPVEITAEPSMMAAITPDGAATIRALADELGVSVAELAEMASLSEEELSALNENEIEALRQQIIAMLDANLASSGSTDFTVVDGVLTA